MTNYAIKVGFATLALCCAVSAQTRNPSKDRIPDEATAIKVGEARLSSIYGKDHIRHEEPFHAALEKGVWTVAGSMPPGSVGGVAVIRLNKKTGRVISYIHTK